MLNMKKQLFFGLFALFLIQKTVAQDCRGFMPFSKNSEWEMTSFDKKGLPETVSASRLVELKPTADGFRASVETALTDEKGKEKSSFNYDFECAAGAIKMDLRSVLAPETFGAYEDMEMTFSGSSLEFPNKMEVGQTLPDAEIEAQVKSGGIILVRMNFKILNRKVVALEEVTTAAGRFDCVKTSYDLESKIGFIKVNASAVQWLAEGVGAVKSENFDKKGKLTSSQQLTKFKKGI